MVLHLVLGLSGSDATRSSFARHWPVALHSIPRGRGEHGCVQARARCGAAPPLQWVLGCGGMASQQPVYVQTLPVRVLECIRVNSASAVEGLLSSTVVIGRQYITKESSWPAGGQRA